MSNHEIEKIINELEGYSLLFKGAADIKTLCDNLNKKDVSADLTKKREDAIINAQVKLVRILNEITQNLKGALQMKKADKSLRLAQVFGAKNQEESDFSQLLILLAEMEGSLLHVKEVNPKKVYLKDIAKLRGIIQAIKGVDAVLPSDDGLMFSFDEPEVHTPSSGFTTVSKVQPNGPLPSISEILSSVRKGNPEPRIKSELKKDKSTTVVSPVIEASKYPESYPDDFLGFGYRPMALT